MLLTCIILRVEATQPFAYRESLSKLPTANGPFFPYYQQPSMAAWESSNGRHSSPQNILAHFADD
jgi:hypothetical protein